MAEAAAAPPPLETKVSYSADGKRVVLKCSMCVPDICSAPSKRAYTRNKKGKLPWGIPSAAPSRLPRTNAHFDDLVGHPRRRTSCGEARSRHGGPSVSQPFYSYSPKFIFESTAKGPTRPGAYRRVHSAALVPARRLLPGRSSPFAPSLALRWQREPPSAGEGAN